MVGSRKSLARELGSRSITVNCVAPGFIDTDMTRALPEEQRKALLGADPARPPRRSREDIAACGRLPRVARGRLHHRRDPARQRRHVHDREQAIGRGPSGLRAPCRGTAAVRIARLIHDSRRRIMSNIEARVKKIVAEQLGVKEDEVINERIVVRRRPRRRLARHRRAGDGARRRVRDRDPGRGSREDHHRAAGHRLHQRAHVRRPERRPAASAPASSERRRTRRRHRPGHRLSPVGNTRRRGLGSNLLAGTSRHRADHPASTRRAFASRIAGEVKGFDVEQYMPPKEARHMDPFIHYGMAAGAAGARATAALRGRRRRTPSASASASAPASAACR